MLSVSLTLFSPTASASSPYCGGQNLSNFQYCYGAARNLSEVRGYGLSHSVCVGAGAIFGGCSGGPNQIVSANFGSVFHIEPWIEDNAAGATVVYGEAL
jgi:hypothetical protein